MELESPLASCVWTNHTLHGVKRYPLFVADILPRSVSVNTMVAAARAYEPGKGRLGEERIRRASEALREPAWILGGIDEASREDEIQKVVVQ